MHHTFRRARRGFNDTYGPLIGAVVMLLAGIVMLISSIGGPILNVRNMDLSPSQFGLSAAACLTASFVFFWAGASALLQRVEVDGDRFTVYDWLGRRTKSFQLFQVTDVKEEFMLGS